jgi:hypothetical protein
MGYQPQHQRPWATSSPPRPTFPENATAFLEDCEAWWAWLKVATPEQIEDEPASGHRWLRSMGWQPPHLLTPVGIGMSGVELIIPEPPAIPKSHRVRYMMKTGMNLPTKPPIIPKGQCSPPPRDP